ncbi:hypothetical protein SEVIR_2G427250v4 [Setaria viridis]|uniref:Uncharacterized protein n=1 Tax=Setaria viridis TaxID=4556 RepID=A0A4U6WEF3_SETVI|nr:hypothetical protein SEVIR_2G427250v2 [Setaria viridis]TKW36237.1 hypothetical protein SEVIR_2G427250v2 [Setaria viridis]
MHLKAICKQFDVMIQIYCLNLLSQMSLDMKKNVQSLLSKIRRHALGRFAGANLAPLLPLGSLFFFHAIQRTCNPFYLYINGISTEALSLACSFKRKLWMAKKNSSGLYTIY